MISNKIIGNIINQCKHFINSGSDDAVIDNAKRILTLRLQRHRLNALENYHSVKEYLTLWFDNEEGEKLCCLFLDQEHKFIECHNILFGSINHCESHVIKEIARIAVICNASAIIFSSNVPSIEADDIKSSSIVKLKTIQKALDLINVRVIDHVLICGANSFSFKERNMI